MKSRENNYAFIDSQNLNLGVRSQGWVLDFIRFRVFLRDKYNVDKAFLCIGHVDGNESLYAFLQNAGYICIFKPTLEIKESGKIKTKGNVDAEMVLYSMIEWNNYDKAVIVSGDGDFYCLIKHLLENKKLRKVIVPNYHFSSLIRKFGNNIVNIQMFKDKLKFKNRPLRGG